MAARTNKRANDPPSRSVAVIGAGYVGLPTAATLAHFGHRVVLAEREPARLAALRSGRMPIVEAGLDDLVAEGVAAGTLRFTDSARRGGRAAPSSSSCACPRPRATTGRPTSPTSRRRPRRSGPLPGSPGPSSSTSRPCRWARPAGRAGRSAVPTSVSSPTPSSCGRARRSTTASTPTASWWGPTTAGGGAAVGALFAATGAPLIVTDATTAETIKYASNAFLATKLSFVNAVAGLCEAVGADVRDVMLGLGYDKRIGFDFLRPGPGWGGSCLPKDTARPAPHRRGRPATTSPCCAGPSPPTRSSWPGGGQGGGGRRRLARRGDGRRLGPDLQGAHRRPARLARAWRSPAGWSSRARRSGPTTRRSPADARPTRPGPRRAGALRADPYEAAPGRGGLVVLTEWDEFRWLDFAKVRDLMADPAVVDARNLLDPAALAAALGFRLHRAIGPPDEPGRGGRRRRLPRLAPVRACRPGRRWSASTTCPPGAGERGRPGGRRALRAGGRPT